MSVFLFSMAGLPVTAGFFGKVFILFGAINGSFYWLAGIMFATSVLSFYYYIGVMRRMFSDPESPVPVPALRVDSSISLTVWISLLVTVVLGVVPNLLMHVLNGLKWFG
jgi:NADH-quinone oxidoreductase subunit N